MLICESCGKLLTNKAALVNHQKSHVREDVLNIIPENAVCEYGCGHRALFRLKNKKMCCSKFQTQCSVIRQRNKQALANPEVKANHKASMEKSYRDGKRIGWTEAGKRLKGKTYEEILGKERAEEVKAKISRASLANGISTWARLDDEKKQILKQAAKERINKRYANGWMPKAGRCKKIHYSNRVGTIVIVDGFWELLVAFYFDIQGYAWTRNENRFEYIKKDGKIAFYTPDFFLMNKSSYIEVKGYEDELSKIKREQFQLPLIVFKKAEIKNIEHEINITALKIKNRFESQKNISYQNVVGLIAQGALENLIKENVSQVKQAAQIVSKKIKAKHSRLITKKIYFCKVCGNDISRKAKNQLCVKCHCKSTRKIERPSLDILLKEVKEASYLAVGKKYGVSDNAIRKWIENYSKNGY